MKKTKITVPDLGDGPARSGSWIVCRFDGSRVGEFFTRRAVEQFNGSTCFAVPVGAYLGAYNAAVKAAGGVEPTAEAYAAAILSLAPTAAG